MKIDSDRLRILRERKGFTRPKLEKLSGITERTIQRLEREPHRSQKTREDTLNGLAKALSVEPGVLTGELPLPESDDTLTDDNLDRVQIGAQVAPKTRLAYDLIKRRYGVNATEIIDMAPLFFALLAEGSLAWRREKLKEADEMIRRLDEMSDEIGYWMFNVTTMFAEGASSLDEESISKADLFGDHLFNDDGYTTHEPFDFKQKNPFAHHLRKLVDELAVPGVVDVDRGDLSMASNYKFPNYDICRDELDHIANGSSDARNALVTGCVRLSEIPDELMDEDAGEERARWLEERLPDMLKEISNENADFIAELPEVKDLILKHAPKTNSENEKGDDQ